MEKSELEIEKRIRQNNQEQEKTKDRYVGSLRKLADYYAQNPTRLEDRLRVIIEDLLTDYNNLGELQQEFADLTLEKITYLF